MCERGGSEGENVLGTKLHTGPYRRNIRMSPISLTISTLWRSKSLYLLHSLPPTQPLCLSRKTRPPSLPHHGGHPSLRRYAEVRRPLPQVPLEFARNARKQRTHTHTHTHTILTPITGFPRRHGRGYGARRLPGKFPLMGGHGVGMA